ncbi:MAG TPA: hypothetical protein VIU64_16405 [Polyangia bacterium]
MAAKGHGRVIRTALSLSARWGALSAIAAGCLVAAGALVVASGRTRPAGAASASAALEPARMKLVTALVDETLKGILPFTFNLPAPTGPGADGGVTAAFVPATLFGLRYCGVTEQGAGRFRAVIRLAGIPAAAGDTGALAPILGEGECRTPLSDLGKRLDVSSFKDDAAMVLADLEAAWRAWELHLVVTRFVSAGEPRATVGWGDGRREILAFSTAGVAVPTELGPLVFHVAPTFASDGLEVAAVLAESGSAPPSSRPPLGPALVMPLAADAAANALFEVPYGLAHYLVHTYTAKPVPVRIGREIVDVQNASLRGASGSLTVVALGTSRSIPEAARVTVTSTGDDLRVGTVRAEPQLESCAGQGMVASLACNARNAARNAAAAALGGAATDRYQNQLLRELAGGQELRFTFARRELRMTAELVRIGAAARGLGVAARLVPGTAATP